MRNLAVPPEGDDSNRPHHDQRLRQNFQITQQKHPYLTYEIYEKHFGRLDSMRHTFESNYTVDFDLPPFRWQKSFRDHVIRDQKDFKNHCDYIYNNALKHGLTSEPSLWPWTWTVGLPAPTL